MATTIPMKIEPKTFFANERTFLSWLHMAVTIGSIGAALLGFSGAATHDPKAPAVRASCTRPQWLMCGTALHAEEGRSWFASAEKVTGCAAQVGIENVPDIIAMILLPVAVLMCGYALMVFLWRGSQIARKQARLLLMYYIYFLWVACC